MNKRLMVLAALVFCIGQESRAQNPVPALDELFHQAAGNTSVPFSGVVVVAEEGRIIYQQAAGDANRAAKIPNSDSTRFQLASLSKVFTAVAVMQLVEKGRIGLDDPLVKYLPDFPYPDITIRQLLSHSSGLPDFNEVFGPENIPDHALTNADLIPVLRKNKSIQPVPGKSWHYSSIGYGLLALLVEKVSKLPFPEFLIQSIFLPAGMTQSYLLTAFDVHPDRQRAVLYIGPATADSLRADQKNPWQTIYGPGLVVSSAKDLLLFDQALRTNKILSAATQMLMYTPVTLSGGQPAQLEHAPIFAGLGWGIDMDPSSGRIVSHNGGSPGISTIFLRNLDKGQTVIVLENVDNRVTLDIGVNSMNILNHRPLMRFRDGPHP